MSYFEKAFNDVIIVEGGYSNNPTDKGGKTKYGVTESVARSYGYNGTMENLTLDFAKEVYRNGYWKKEFDNFSERTACFLFDCNVNHGYKGMSLILQRSVNLLTKDNIAEDGYAGNATYSKAKELNEKRLFTVLNAVRCKYFIDICIKNESQEDFIYGWLSKRIKWELVK